MPEEWVVMVEEKTMFLCSLAVLFFYALCVVIQILKLLYEFWQKFFPPFYLDYRC